MGGEAVKNELERVDQGAVRDSMTFEWGLYDWIDLVKHKLQHEQRPRNLNELCVYKEMMLSISGERSLPVRSLWAPEFLL